MTYYNALTVRDQLKAMIAAEQLAPRAVILDAAVQDTLDVTSVEVMQGFVKEMHSKGIAICVAELHAPATQFAQRIEPNGIVGEVRLFPTVDAAIRSLGDDTILPADDLSHMERIK